MELKVLNRFIASEVYLRTIMDLLDAGAEKPPWSTVEGAEPEIQELYAQ